MNRIKDFLRKRYGMDLLNKALLLFYFLFLFIYWLSKLKIFMYLGLFFIAFQLFRFFSSNHNARARENMIFLKYWNKTKRFFTGKKKRITDPHYKYFKCPNCKTEVRVPKNKGKIRITCPKCKNVFIRKT